MWWESLYMDRWSLYWSSPQFVKCDRACRVGIPGTPDVPTRRVLTLPGAKVSPWEGGAGVSVSLAPHNVLLGRRAETPVQPRGLPLLIDIGANQCNTSAEELREPRIRALSPFIALQGTNCFSVQGGYNLIGTAGRSGLSCARDELSITWRVIGRSAQPYGIGLGKRRLGSYRGSVEGLGYTVHVLIWVLTPRAVTVSFRKLTYKELWGKLGDKKHRSGKCTGTLLLTWINFDPRMDK